MARVLGIDTALRSTGVGVVDAQGSKLSAVEAGVICSPRSRSHSECLTTLYDGLVAIMDRTRPEAVAIEGAFYHQNVKTAMVLGEVRGVAIAACAGQGLPVFEYAPRRVKQAIVGVGSATKAQVRRMVMTLLALDDEPQEDAGDALALAVCHLHNRTGIGALQVKPI